MTIYLDHFGLSEAPFKITPHTEFFFAGANRGETLEALIYAITSGEGIVKVVGEVGSGKTMLCRVLMERLPKTVETIYLAVPSLTRDEMLAVIADDLGIETQGAHTTKLVRALQARLIDIHAEGRQVVALIDEAHAMPMETLEEIRLLSNLETSQHKLMQIVLFGQPELDQHLSLPHMRQLKERITHSFNLLPLPARDIRDYLNFRLRAAGYKGPDLFSKDALDVIADASEGLTRRINIYADKTLLAAYAEGTHTITAKHVRAAVSDTQIVPQDNRRGRKPVWIAAATGLAAGLLIGFFAGRETGVGAAEGNGKAIAAAPAKPVQTAPAAVAPSTAAPAAPNRPAPGEAMVKPAAPPTAAVGTEAKASDAKAVQSTPGTVPAADWLAKRLDADGNRLKGSQPERWAIQLLTADRRERSALENYLSDAGRVLKEDDLLLFASGTRDNPRIGVVYGDFASRAAAQSELAKLPQRLGQFKPYVRSFQAIRDDLRPQSSS
jgi:type II secretory pathway predicted ATPase ExeA